MLHGLADQYTIIFKEEKLILFGQRLKNLSSSELPVDLVGLSAGLVLQKIKSGSKRVSPFIFTCQKPGRNVAHFEFSLLAARLLH